MKLHKDEKFILILVFAAYLIGILVGTAHAVEGSKIGEVDCVKRLLQGNDTINIIRVDDPDNPFISIYFTTIKTGQIFALADPSNTAIAARLTGDIPVDSDGVQIINKDSSLNIASISKSIGSKTMKIARFYDAEKNVLVYLVYTTKLIDGSLKHSLSVVPLGKPLIPK
jgi:CreA protein